MTRTEISAELIRLKNQRMCDPEDDYVRYWQKAFEAAEKFLNHCPESAVQDIGVGQTEVRIQFQNFSAFFNERGQIIIANLTDGTDKPFPKNYTRADLEHLPW